jgi:hypothetical protein
MKIRYVNVPSFPGYRVGTDGSVWSINGRYCVKKWRKLKPWKTYNGYLQLMLYSERKPIVFSVHRLILLSFVGPCPEGMECLHLNNDKQDNRPSNLKWGSQKQNMEQRQQEGGYAIGEKHHSSKLTRRNVIWIRKNYPRITMGDMGRKFNVTLQAIWLIVHRKNWRHVK